MTACPLRRLLLVCTGNTCRSPMAAALLRRRLDELGPPWSAVEVRSAGLAVAGTGQGATEHALQVMAEKGLDLGPHRSRPISPEELDAADLILTMTAGQKAEVFALRPRAADRLFVLREFTRGAAARRLDIADPLGRGLRAYRRIARELEKEVRRLVEVLVSTYAAEEDLLMDVITKPETRRRDKGQAEAEAGPAPSPESRAKAGDALAIGADHAGFRLKDELTGVAAELGYEVVDFGTGDSSAVDYPDLAAKVAHAVAAGRCRFGLLVCGTGLGMAIAANKVPGIRAVTCNSLYLARMAREHNDANVLCIGARVVGGELAAEILRVFLATPFGGQRHARRVQKIRDLEADGRKEP